MSGGPSNENTHATPRLCVRKRCGKQKTTPPQRFNSRNFLQRSPHESATDALQKVLEVKTRKSTPKFERHDQNIPTFIHRQLGADFCSTDHKIKHVPESYPRQIPKSQKRSFRFGACKRTALDQCCPRSFSESISFSHMSCSVTANGNLLDTQQVDRLQCDISLRSTRRHDLDEIAVVCSH